MNDYVPHMCLESSEAIKECQIPETGHSDGPWMLETEPRCSVRAARIHDLSHLWPTTIS